MRVFRPFRSRLSVLYVMLALALTLGACFGSGDPTGDSYCEQNPTHC